MKHRLRVLLGAFAVSPIRGGEPTVGWKVATHICRHADITVLYGDVRRDRRAETEMLSYLRDNSAPPGLDFVYVGPSPLTAFLERLHGLPGCWMLYYLAYRLWQKSALEKARQLHSEAPFEVAHQLTYIGYREPGYLWQLGIPFVWGPVSGAENIPPAFYRSFKSNEIFRPLSRDLGNRVQACFPGRIRKAAEAAAKIFSVSSAEENLFSKWNIPSERMLETGTTTNPRARLRHRKHDRLKLVWSGLFTPRKAFPILIHALAELKCPKDQWSLVVLGDGPMESLWKQGYLDAGLPAQNIAWLGRVAHCDAIDCMAEGDVLVHTGLREGTPHVVLESLALGMPVLCHDAGGMGTAVIDSCGIRVPLRDFNFSVTHFSLALERLLMEPDLLGRLSAGALQRAAELSWEAIAARFMKTYHEVSGN